MVTPVTHETLQTTYTREFLLLCGHWKSGKTYAILSLAQALESEEPDALVYVIDTEDGIIKTWKEEFPSVKNLHVYPCGDMEEVVQSLNTIRRVIKPIDWLCVESMSRIWGFAQDLGYIAVTGLTKDEYLSGKDKEGPVTPRPDMLWQVVRNIHNRNFMDIINHRMRCNVLLTTKIGAERGAFFASRESPTRQRAQQRLGLNIRIEGEPRLPYYPDTIVLMERMRDVYQATVLGDRAHDEPGKSVNFKVTNFWTMFQMMTGRMATS